MIDTSGRYDLEFDEYYLKQYEKRKKLEVLFNFEFTHQASKINCFTIKVSIHFQVLCFKVYHNNYAHK